MRAFLILLPALLLPANSAFAEPLEAIATAIEQSITRSPQWESVEAADVRLESGAVPENAVVNVVESGASNPLGRRMFRLSVETAAGRSTASVSANIRAYATVYHLAKSLAKGERVRPGDLVARRMDVTRIPPDAVTEPSEAEGLAAIRPLAANVLLKRIQIGPVPDAKKGEKVILLADDGRIRVVAHGVMKEDGHKGEFVRAANLMSGREVSGWLVEPGVVKVTF
ncbi:MAG: flagellar basal body P-ring formation protein FlgA [Nitrospirae bacterium]|nr:flagellar basal body P-ring formation protein FlgA [Nitrospirota bacterium]